MTTNEPTSFTKTRAWRVFKVIYWIAAPALALYYQSTANFGYMAPLEGYDPAAFKIINDQAAWNARASLYSLPVVIVVLFLVIRKVTKYIVGR